jgi:hypothetical protein
LLGGFIVAEKIAATGVSVEFDGLMKDENMTLSYRWLFFHRCFIISFSNEKKRIVRQEKTFFLSLRFSFC